MGRRRGEATPTPLFVFLHREEAYKNRVWVLIDGGAKERTVMMDLRETYGKHGWRADQFRQFEQHDFEKYYPSSFSEQIEAVLTMQGDRRKAKGALLADVEKWIADNEDQARSEFETSAAEVIKVLRDIEEELREPSGPGASSFMVKPESH